MGVLILRSSPKELSTPVPGCRPSAWAPSAPTMSAADEIAAAVEGAAAVGYRHFDCASVYGNEREIGYALQQILRRQAKREQLWITSKLWNDKHGEADVIPSCKQSLADLQTRLPGPVPGPLALPQFPSAGLRCKFPQPRRKALHPRELHEDLAARWRNWWTWDWCATSAPPT